MEKTTTSRVYAERLRKQADPQHKEADSNMKKVIKKPSRTQEMK